MTEERSSAPAVRTRSAAARPGAPRGRAALSSAGITTAPPPAMAVLAAGGDREWLGDLRRTLGPAGFRLVAVRDPCRAQDALHRSACDIVLLDLQRGETVAHELVAGLRLSAPTAFILVLSHQHASGERIRCFQAGADDYIHKPVLLSELMARMLALLRRSGRLPPAARPLALIELDARRRVMHVSGQRLVLLPPEWVLLERLARSAGRVVRLPTLLDAARRSGLQLSALAAELHLARLAARLAGSGLQIQSGPGQRHCLVAAGPVVLVEPGRWE